MGGTREVGLVKVVCSVTRPASDRRLVAGGRQHRATETDERRGLALQGQPTLHIHAPRGHASGAIRIVEALGFLGSSWIAEARCPESLDDG